MLVNVVLQFDRHHYCRLPAIADVEFICDIGQVDVYGYLKPSLWGDVGRQKVVSEFLFQEEGCSPFPLGNWFGLTSGELIVALRDMRLGDVGEFLKLSIASICMDYTALREELLTSFQIQEATHLSFHNTYLLLKKIDQLPTSSDWVCDIVKVEGNLDGDDGEMMGEELDLWHHNPLEFIQEIN